MNRRKFFKNSVFSAIGTAGLLKTAQAAESAKSTDNNVQEYDIVVIGSGCAGLTVAIEAADLGAKVVVLEKMFGPFGNTIYAGGNFNATNTRVQRRDGIKDTVEDFYNDLRKVSMYRGDPVLTKMFAEQSADVVQWLTDRVHMEWKPIDVQIAPMLGRCHEVGGKLTLGGNQLIRNMLDECKLLNVPIHTRTKAVELLRDESYNCTGVKAVRPKGPVTYKARGGVVICTGGFHNNKDMVTRYMGGNVAWMPLRGSAIITGENYTLTQPFFPQYVNMDQFHAGPIHPTTLANPSNMVNFGICVTPQGKRYIDEGQTYVYVGQNTPKLIKENRAFIIIDSRVVDEPIVARRIKRYQKAKAEIYKADTIAELAKQMGVPVDTLVNTVKEFNAAVHNGTTDKLAVPTTLEKPYTIEKAPFYGCMFAGGMTATFGGPKINPKAQIINTEGQPIPGLYGAGNAVGGIFYDNYLDGSQLTAAVIWGRIAAREALARAKAMKG